MQEEEAEQLKLTEREQKALDRKQRTQEAANKEKALQAEYHKIKNTPAFLDLLEKMQSFADYHGKVARDGVGYEQKTHADGSVEQVIVHLTAERRVSELDKSAGIEEIIDYATRKTTISSKATKEKE